MFWLEVAENDGNNVVLYVIISQVKRNLRLVFFVSEQGQHDGHTTSIVRWYSSASFHVSLMFFFLDYAHKII